MELKNEKLTESEIRILILEDVLTDAEILRREIEQAGIGFISQIVDNQKNFLEALHNFKPDIILSDYMLPEFNGMLALRLTKEFDPSIPFIIVTGSINEETAVKCMKAGAYDYVIKEHLTRVVPAIKAALEKNQLIKEKEKTEEKLRKSEEQFRLIAENIADMIVVLDIDGKRIYNSPSYKDTIGDTEALPGTDSFQEIHPEDREKIKKIFNETVKTGIGQRAEYRLLGKDGSIYFIESQGSVIKDESGKIVNVIVVSRDVTKRKMDEKMLKEKEEFLSNIIENIPHLIYIKDAKDLRYVRLNKACELEWGYKREELIGKNDYDFFPENEAEFSISKDREVLNKKQLINIPEESVQTKFVGKRIMHTKKIPILDNNGNPQFLLGISEDITVRRRVEEALAQERYLMNMLIENIPDVIYFKDTDSRFIRMNKAQAERFGLSNPAQATGKTDFDFFKEEHARPAFEDEQTIIRTGKPIIGIEEMETWPDGRETWVSTTKMPLRDKEGNIIGTFGVSRDITERKQTEKALQESEEHFRELYENAKIGLYRTTPDGTILMANKVFVKMLGYPSFKKLAERNLEKDGYEPTYQRKEFLEKIEKNGEVNDFESKWIRQDGSVFFVRESAQAIRDSQGTTLYYDGMVEDVTERKRAEEALNESEERFRSLFTASPDAIMLLDTSDPSGYWPIVDCNDIACQMNGYTREELIGKPVDILNISVGTPEEHAAYLDRIRRESVMRFETFHRHRDGHIFPIEVSTSIVMFRGRELILGIDRDITERRRAEEALVQEQYLMNMLMDNVPDHIYFKDTDSRFIRINKDQARIFGFSNPIQAIGKTDFDFFTEEHARPAFEDEQTIIRTGKSIIGIEERETWPDGRETWASTTKMPLHDKEGNIIGTFGVSRDITERKQMEILLATERNLLHTLIDSLPDHIYAKDTEGRFTMCNTGEIRHHGASTPSELIGKTDFDFYPRELAEKYHADEQAIIQSGQPLINREEPSIDAVGNPIWNSTTKVPLRDQQGRIVGLVGTSRDITERKRAEEALVQEQYLMNMLMDNVPDYIYFKDTDSRFIRMNMEHAKKFGLSNPIQAIGKTDFDFYPRELAEKYHADEQAIIQSGQPLINREEPSLDAAGNPIWNSTTKVPLRDQQGRIVGLVGTSRDITERKQAEKQINLLAHTVRSVSECVSITDLNDIILYVNDAFLNTYGYAEYEILGKNIEIVRSPKNPLDLAGGIHDKARDAGWHGELLNQTKDGREFPIFLSTSVVRDDNGQAVALVGVASDITERKLAEQALKESEERYRFIVEATSDVIYQIKYNSVVYDYINPTIENLTGYTSEEINSIGFSNIIEKVKRLDNEKVKSNVDHGKFDTEEWKTDYQIRTKSGKLIWISDTSYPWLNNDGKPIGRIGIMRDITDRVLVQEEIIKAKENAEEMNRLKSSFLANMSHELRTPLIGILGFADILKDESKEKEQKEMAETILESGNRLSQTLNLILDLSKVEAETLKINSEEIELNDFIRNQVKSFNKSLRKKGVKLKMNLFEESVYANLDKVLLNSVINNLVNNAIKYTDKGEVVISVKKLVEKDGELAEIIVKDTGIGISKENLDIIFEPFRQASEGYTRKFEGTGLGLTLVKKYVKNMNGEIIVVSEIGVGSEFKIRFPAIIAPTKKKLKSELKEIVKEAEFEPSVYEKPLILHVDDDNTTRDVVKRYADKYCNIDGVSNGEEAVEFAKMKKYDLILMDISLGKGMSGLATAAKIKEIPGCENIPIVAVTAYALAGDREKFLEHGCTHYLPKPFIREQLISKLKDILKLEFTK
jgi:PAS domain S-box-containing protein